MTKVYTLDDIDKDPTFQKFLKKKTGRRPKTIENYLYTLKFFCNFVGKSPTEIHDLHRKDLRNRVAEFDMWLTEALDDYISYLIEKNNSYNYIKSNLSRIKSYLHAFKLRPTPEMEIPKNNVLEDAKYTLKVEDIRKAIQHSPPTYQVIFITQAQTGLSISDTLLLDVEDFIKAVSNRDENLQIIEDLTLKEAIYRVKTNPDLIGCFDLRRKKTLNEFYTFAGPETLRNIAQLLESRADKYNQPNAPIFIKEICRLPQEKRENLSLEELRLTPEMAKNFTIRLHKQRKIFPQIEVDGKKRNYFRTHKLRKWYANQIRFKAGFNSDDTKYLMGQKTGDVLEHYIDPNNYQALKNNYRKALPYLAINDEIVMEENKEAIEQLQKDKEEIKEQMLKQEEKHKAEMQSQAEAHEAEMAKIQSQMVYLVTKTEENSKSIINIERLKEELEKSGGRFKKSGKRR